MVKLKHLFIAFALIVLGGGNVQAAVTYEDVEVDGVMVTRVHADLNDLFNEYDNNCTYNKDSHVFEWTANSNNVYDLKDFLTGNLSNYTKFVVKVSGLPENCYFRLFVGEPEIVSEIRGVNGENIIILDKYTNINKFRIGGIGGAWNYTETGLVSSGSMTIEDVYLEKPKDSNPIDLPALAKVPNQSDEMIRMEANLESIANKWHGDFFYDQVHHYGKWKANSNNLVDISFGLPTNDEAKKYTTIYINVSILEGQSPRFLINGESFYLTDGINKITIPQDIEITQYRIGGAGSYGGGTATGACVFHYVYAEGPKVKKIQGNAYQRTPLTQAMFHVHDAVGGNETGEGNCVYEIDVETEMPYGDSNVDHLSYVDLADYDYLELVKTDGGGTPRFLFNRLEYNGTVYGEIQKGTHESFWKVTGNTYLVDLQKVKAEGSNGTGHVHLHAIKKPWGDGKYTVTSLTLLKKGDCGYVLSGTGELTDVASALADKTLTSVDATGLTNEEAIEISTGNPNCLMIANTGKLSNPDNVLIKGADDSYSCASLSLKDANDFAAPVDFTATDAAFKRTATGYDGWATVCLPFAANVPEGVEAWEIESVKAGALNMKSITTIPANKAVLLQFDEATGLAVYASSATVAKTVAASESGKTELVGVYAKQQAPVGSYVLQKKDGTLAFYKVETDKQPNIPAFRAYLVVNSEGAKPNMMGINFEETTGISDMQNNETILTPAMKYNMAGQSVQHMKKGVQIQRMSDGSVRKVMVK